MEMKSFGKLPMVLVLLGLFQLLSIAFAELITDPTFEFGDEQTKVAIYRLIGNDMPPLQMRGQLRWNTEYALNYEAAFPGARKRWILNRIWNETEFTMLYSDLLSSGVHRRDIITRCFDLAKYDKFPNMVEKMLYLTSQNEARNAGIIDGKQSGFEWSVILDGNTFMTMDSWEKLQAALSTASAKGQKYLKLPYHRVHVLQDSSWLNTTTSMKTVLKFAPTKGESQVAFHRTADEMFSLGDTNPGKADPTKRRGYGQRNKSYMFKEGGICEETSTVCACAGVVEGNEEDMVDLELKMGEYTKKCGLVLRLWNYPTPDVIHTGLTDKEELGFFCYFQEEHDNILGRHPNECTIMHDGLKNWIKLKESEKQPYRKNGQKCKDDYHLIYLKESCFRSSDRDLAQQLTSVAIENMIPENGKGIKSTLCERLVPSKSSPRKRYLTVFDDKTLEDEKKKYRGKDKSANKDLVAYIDDLVRKADQTLKLGPYTVTSKKMLPPNEKDKRYYYTSMPFQWHVEDLNGEMKELYENGMLASHKGFVTVDGVRAPGTEIGGVGQDLYDRSTVWYLLHNVTTLSLAWYFTDNEAYAEHGASLARAFFLDKTTGMLPSLQYARNGDKGGLLEWKDMYVLWDALTLLERSGHFTQQDSYSMQVWCASLANWYMTQPQGREEGKSMNNPGLLFDISVLGLAIFGRNDAYVDMARSRLHFRLACSTGEGHFDKDGTPIQEVGKSSSLHLATYTIAGWMHAAMMVDAVRANAELPNAMESLWWVRHDGEDKSSQPVLVKAIRWLVKYLPDDSEAFTAISNPVKGMGVNFPFNQETPFAFDRMLEVIHYGVQYYGVSRIFADKKSKSAQAALTFPLYSTRAATYTQYSSVDPDSGTRLWPALGVPQHRGTNTPPFW